MKRLLILSLVMTVFSCGPGEAPPPPPAPVSTEGATAGYTLESLPRTDLMKAFKYDPEGQVLEMGYFLDDRPEGTWYYYEHPTKEFPKRIVSYHAGILNGPYMELTENGTVSLQAYYENNELNGHWGTYKFGRPIKTADYENGILEGFYREYTTTAGKLQKEIHYKNGKEDGPYRFYNDRGEITLEYTYKNGEKVGGGVIESDRPNVPR